MRFVNGRCCFSGFLREVSSSVTWDADWVRTRRTPKEKEGGRGLKVDEFFDCVRQGQKPGTRQAQLACLANLK